MMRRKGAMLEEAVEQQYNSLHKSSYPLQNVNNLGTFDASLVEGYVDGRIGIHFHLGADSPDSGFCLRLSYIGKPDGIAVSDGSDNRISCEEWIEAGQQYPSVLVDVRQIIEGKNKIVFNPARVKVWLQTLDGCFHCVGEPIKPPAPDRLFETLRATADRKGILFTGHILRSKYKFPYQVIERRPEVLQAIPHDEGDFLGNRSIDDQPSDDNIAVRVDLGKYVARYALKIPGKFGLQSFRVLFSPTDFETTDSGDAIPGSLSSG
jgi:hypothetical protein